MSGQRVSRFRVLMWIMISISLLLLSHFIFEIAKSGPTVFRIGQSCEVGSNGMALRVLCTNDSRESIAWDDVGTTPRFRTGMGVTFVQVPIWLIFLSTALLAIAFSWLERRRGVRMLEVAKKLSGSSR